MTEDEQIAQYLATKGATVCPPAFGGVKSSAGALLPAEELVSVETRRTPQRRAGKNPRGRAMRQRWAWYGRSN